MTLVIFRFFFRRAQMVTLNIKISKITDVVTALGGRIRHNTARTNLIRHDVKTYQDSRRYICNDLTPGFTSLWVTMWIELLSSLVIDRQEKLAT